MQTKRQIHELLQSAGVSPNRRLGQHFLVDLNLMRLLVDSADPGPQDVVLEVGCGTGSLTEALTERAGVVVAVELDPTLAAIAKLRLTMPPESSAEDLARSDAVRRSPGCPDGHTTNVQIVNADVLSGKGMLNPEVVEALVRARTGQGRLLLVSNLPYDVASPVMAHLVKGPAVADAMFVTVQREVAERMAAGPGSRDYGTLSILLQATGQVEILRILKPGVFWPPPNVDSAMVRFTRDDRKCRQIKDMAALGNVVGLFMRHRRKMLRACLRGLPAPMGDHDRWLRVFEQHSIDPTLRPGDLTPAQYVALANACCCDD
jgi:16S rRNA (adenine1518-N6/adenine1519-N6)-dimethyltransferase